MLAVCRAGPSYRWNRWGEKDRTRSPWPAKLSMLKVMLIETQRHDGEGEGGESIRFFYII